MRLILVRHGESIWNSQNLFTGWHDSDLSSRGQEQAWLAGQKIREKGLACDLIFSSLLTRAIRTAWIIMDSMKSLYIPLSCHWQLNERHYGLLQGMNKDDAEKNFGREKIQMWRRGYHIAPPAIEESDPRHPRWDKRYKNLPLRVLPATESLEDTFNRTIPFFMQEIEKHLREKKTVMISAHGNSLRAITKYLMKISDEEISKVNIPNGTPIIYEFDEAMQVKKTDTIDNAH